MRYKIRKWEVFTNSYTVKRLKIIQYRFIKENILYISHDKMNKDNKCQITQPCKFEDEIFFKEGRM